MTAAKAAVQVDALTLVDGAGRCVLDDVSFALPVGAGLGLIGPSGAGKTSLALTLLGEVRAGLRHVAGSVDVEGCQPLTMSERHRRRFRRTRTAWLGQDPAAALTPTMTVSALTTEPLRPAERTPERLHAALTAVGLPTDPEFCRRRPHEISGGQRRRVALARALVREPTLLVLDEPLAGLDPDSRRAVLTEIETVRRRRDLTLVVISHDLDALHELTDDLLVLDAGRIVDRGQTTPTLRAPRQPTTITLVDALRPRPLRALVPDRSAPVILTVDGLTVSTPRHETIVDRASFTVAAGEAVAIVGPSGAGKTTLARAIMGLAPSQAGHATVRATVAGSAPRIGYVPQDPATSLNPARPVGTILEAAQRRSPDRPGRSVDDLLGTVGLDPSLGAHHPEALSGGQRQRVALARALARQPDLLVCDEPTSALDPAASATLLDLLDRLRADGLAMILISHELPTLGRLATRVLALHDRTLRGLEAAEFDTFADSCKESALL